MMPNRQPEWRLISSFTSEQWSGRPAKDGGNLFVGLVLIGAVLGLILMIFVPGLRSGGALTLFTAAFAVIFTALAIRAKASAERKFLAQLTATVNDIIVGLTGNIEHRLSSDQLRTQIENGKPLPLLVNGVPGLELQATTEQPPEPARNPAGKRVDSAARITRIAISATPPDYGITSFDRLLAAAAGASGNSGNSDDEVP